MWNLMNASLKALLNEQYKLVSELREENKKLRAYADNLDSENDNQAIEIEELKKENRKLKETIKEHQLYEKKLEHRIVDFEELHLGKEVQRESDGCVN